MNRTDISKLKNNRAIHFKLGLIITLGLVILAFNHTAHLPVEKGYLPEPIEPEIMRVIPRTYEKPPVTPPPAVEPVKKPPKEEMPEFTNDPIPEEVEKNILSKPIKDTIPFSPSKVSAPPVVSPPKPHEWGDQLFIIVEEMPCFPGCESISGKAERKKCADEKMLQFVYKNIKYPSMARENGIEGMVVIQFIVEKDGRISKAKIKRDIGGGCGREALRIVKSMPDWHPGKQRGRPVRVRFNLPVKFEISKQ